MNAIVSGNGCAEQRFEFAPQDYVNVGHRHRTPEIDQARDTKARVGYAAWHDAVKVREVRIDVERKPVHRHPAAIRMPIAAILSS